MAGSGSRPEEREGRAAEGGTTGRPVRRPIGGAEGKHETYYDDEGVFYWMDRDEEKGLEPLSWLGNHFPQGCRFCM